MKTGFNVYLRGDKTFISTYALENPDELWSTLPNPDGYIRYMKEADTDVFTAIFKDKRTV